MGQATYHISQEEWETLLQDDTGKKTIIELAFDPRKVPKSFYSHLVDKNYNEQKKDGRIVMSAGKEPYQSFH